MARARRYLREAWQLVGADLPVFSLAAFIVVSLSALSLFILALPLLVGLCIMCGEKLRGNAPTLAHLWEGVTAHFPASISVWVVYMLAAIPFDILTSYLLSVRGLYVVPGLLSFLGGLWVLTSVLFFALPLIADRDVGGAEALRLSWAAARSDWRGTSALAFVYILTVLFGLFACCAGVILTLPLAVAMQMLAYRELHPAASRAEPSPDPVS